MRTARETPTLVACAESVADEPRAAALRDAGVDVLAFPAPDGVLPLDALLRRLTAAHGASHVLVEAGAGLTRHLLRAGLVNEAWVFVAPMILGADALPSTAELGIDRLADAPGLRLVDHRRRDGDLGSF